MKDPLAILTADWHMRGNKPVCRKDDFLRTQALKVQFVIDLASTYKIPLLIAGDLGDKAYWPNWLLRQMIKQFESLMFCRVPVCVTAHNVERWKEGALGVLEASESIKVYCHGLIPSLSKFDCVVFPYGQPLQLVESESEGGIPFVAMAHQLVVNKVFPRWEHSAQSAKALLKKFPQYQLIVVGDNHQSFVVEYEGRFLVSPGSLMRTTIDQVNHKPCVYLWDGKDVEQVRLPIEQNVIDVSKKDLRVEYDERMDKFMTQIQKQHEIGLSFEKNLEIFFQENRVRSGVKKKVWSSLEIS